MDRMRGVFTTVNDLIGASKNAFLEYSKLNVKSREQLLNHLRSGLKNYIGELAYLSHKETEMGKFEDKILKVKLAIEHTPGTEVLESRAIRGDENLVIFEYFPYGIACAIEPSTNPCETMINNTIGLLAAGNTVINCPHPRAMNVSKYLTDIMNQLIYEACGIENLVVTMDTCLLSHVQEIMTHPDVDLVVSCGGSENARAAINCGKKVLSGGPANPTVIVDETADLQNAARCVVKGASFDNNITCVSEKNVVVVEEVAAQFEAALQEENVFYIKDIANMLKISKVLLTEEMLPNKFWGGKNVNDILKAADIPVDKDYRLIAVETIQCHPLVTNELLVPLVGVVKAKDFGEALETALMIEQKNHHTAGIHTNRLDRMRKAEAVLKTAIFIKNGCSLDGLGISDIGRTTFTVANVTGEGAVDAVDFSRKRRCVAVDGLTM